jgi:hypothetical protein
MKKEKKEKGRQHARQHIGPSSGPNRLRSIDPVLEGVQTLRSRNHLDLPHTASIGSSMREIELLVETYLNAERDLTAAVDAAGGKVQLPDGRTITTGRAEYDAVPSRQRRRAWVMVRQNAPMPPSR